MSSFKDSHPSRPHSQHRTSMTSTTPNNIPIRNSMSRSHAHSMSLGTMNSAHRVSRRKSMNSSTFSNVAALAAALDGDGEHIMDMSQTNRRSLPLKHPSSSGAADSAYVGESGRIARNPDLMDSALDTGKVLESSAITEDIIASHRGPVTTKARNRRASEGATLSKGEGKRVSGELRCEKCGKGYKHSSCLTKHLWEHTPEWSYTSKLLISKHQQVQLLEAASVLVGMNHDLPDIPDSTKMQDSDHSSASPAASGVSDLHDDYLSSAETTPPPNGEHGYVQDSFSTIREKRHSASSSVFSRSYQSASSMPVGNTPFAGHAFGHYHESSSQRRPSTSGIGVPRPFGVDEEDAGLAAAVESLCNFGTPRSGAVQLPSDVPPVPPLPARYAGQSSNVMHATMQPSMEFVPPSLQRVSNERDSLRKTRRKSNAMEDDDFHDHPSSRGRHNEDDDEIMFGRDEAIF